MSPTSRVAAAIFSLILTGLVSCGGGSRANGPGGGGGGNNGPVVYTEHAGANRNVLRLELQPGAAVHLGQWTFDLRVKAVGLEDQDLYGLSFDIEFQSQVGIELRSFTVADPNLVAAVASKQGERNTIMFGIAAGKGPNARLPRDFVIGTLELRASSAGEVKLQFAETRAPGLGTGDTGFGFVGGGETLRVTKGPEVRGGILTLR